MLGAFTVIDCWEYEIEVDINVKYEQLDSHEWEYSGVKGSITLYQMGSMFISSHSSAATTWVLIHQWGPPRGFGDLGKNGYLFSGS